VQSIAPGTCLTTGRLVLRVATAELMGIASAGDSAALAQLLPARIPPDWPPRIDDDGRMAREGFAFVRDLLGKHPDLIGWWGWFVLLQGPEPLLIGAVSPKGPPDPEGTVEVSYGIVGSHQGKGYATEATLGLIEWIERDPRVRKIVAETLTHLAASIAVMQKCGLALIGEGSEPGTIRYGRDRTN
jgi:ribosomal-protein-alanine N-acetyltransferase